MLIGGCEESGTILRKFIYGPGIDEPICMIDAADANKVYYYYFDGLGSVIALSDANSEIVERYSYDVFGEPNRTSDVNNPYLFTGRRYDPETGLYYYRARYYDYYTGRFLQPDPVGYHDSINLYTYADNNPVLRGDPLGLACVALYDGSGASGAQLEQAANDFDYAIDVSSPKDAAVKLQALRESASETAG